MSSKPRPPGFPRRLCDLIGRKVILSRKVSNGLVTIPADTVMTVYASPNWNKINLEGPVCSHCGVAPRVTGVALSDLTLVREC